MEKEVFENWNILKQKIENKNKFCRFKEREICFINLGKNIGFEQNGGGFDFERPVLIFKKFNNRIFLAVPLTSKVNIDKYHFEFIFLNKRSFAILSQIRLIDSKRISRKIGYISIGDFKLIKQKIKEIIFD